MKIEVLENKESLAIRATDLIAKYAEKAIADSGSFSLAVSGGSTPKRMLELLAVRKDIDWPNVHLFQVDERIAPAGDPQRNLTMLLPLLVKVPLGSFTPMDVEADDLDVATAAYADRLAEVTGKPAVLDLVQLGLGSDGHTASLIPNDPVLEVDDRDVATTGDYQGTRRMTLTWPIIDRAAKQLWLIAGESKKAAVEQFFVDDPAIPASLVTKDRAQVLADEAAAGM